MANGKEASDGIASSRNVTTMLAFFGEFVAFDILQGTEHGCPIEVLKIPIDQEDDPTFNPDKVVSLSIALLFFLRVLDFVHHAAEQSDADFADQIRPSHRTESK